VLATGGGRRLAGMKWLVIAALLGGGAFFAWKKFGGSATGEPAELPADKSPGANAANRVNALSGQVPEP
jgi:hypothetical protein